MSQSVRKLAAVLFADIVGYTALMQANERLAHISLQKFKDTLNRYVPAHRGSIINFYGDGCLVLFNSSVDATACAEKLQKAFRTAPEVPVRIGLHAGDVVIEEDNVFGDAVNIASRIESMGVPGSILLSSVVRHQIKNQDAFSLTTLGRHAFKNVQGDMTVYALSNEGLAVPDAGDLQGKFGSAKPDKKISGWVLSAGLLAAIILLGSFYFWQVNTNTPVSASNQTNTIAVFPFHISGSPDLQYLGEGMVDLISTQLDEIPGINSVDPNLVFSKVGQNSLISRQPEKASSLVLALGASEFILGSIVELNNALRITASKYNATGQLLEKRSVEGDKEDQLAQTVDKLIRQLVADKLRTSGQELLSLAAITSDNLESLKAYLQGEQAYRTGNYLEAFDLFKQATALDSSFALAWMRQNDAGSWNLGIKTADASAQWAKLRHRLPRKWQEYYDAYQLHMNADRKAITAYKNLNQKYGETRAFINGIAEFLFHFNPSYGRSVLESRLYFEKTLALDENNAEALIHLGDMATFEKDTHMLVGLMEKVDQQSEVFLRLKMNSLLFKDMVTDEEIKSIINHPRFTIEVLTHIFYPIKNEPMRFKLMEQALSLSPNEELSRIKATWKSAFQGKEKLNYTSWQQLGAEPSQFFFPFDQYQRCMPATLMADPGFLPHQERYAELYQSVKDRNTPWDTYAAIKYALALQRDDEVLTLKQKLQSLATGNRSRQMVRHYDFSLRAFEARVAGQHELALSYIDSAYQHPFGFWEIQSSSLDKTIMAANIYAEQGEYEKAIAYYEHRWPSFGSELFIQGFAPYQLSQWHEQLGNIDQALIHCNLLLEGFRDCDPKYQPWVEETLQRKARLIAKLK